MSCELNLAGQLSGLNKSCYVPKPACPNQGLHRPNQNLITTTIKLLALKIRLDCNGLIRVVVNRYNILWVVLHALQVSLHGLLWPTREWRGFLCMIFTGLTIHGQVVDGGRGSSPTLRSLFYSRNFQAFS